MLATNFSPTGALDWEALGMIITFVFTALGWWIASLPTGEEKTRYQRIINILKWIRNGFAILYIILPKKDNNTWGGGSSDWLSSNNTNNDADKSDT